MGDSRLLLLLIPLSYLLGSIPFGLLVGKARGIDVRTAGSGNIGATNVGRLLGKRYFLLVFLLDLLKGMAPMLAASALVGEARDWTSYALWLLVGFAAILGHMFSIFLGFKGGKGVATSAGVMLGLFPYYTYPGLIALGIWIVLFALTRYVSVASMLAALSLPLLYLLIGYWRHWPVLGEQLPLLAFAVLVALLIVYRHRGNIARLRAGTENRFR